MRALLITLAVLVATCLAELFKAPANADGLDAGAISAPEFPLQVSRGAKQPPTHTHRRVFLPLWRWSHAARASVGCQFSGTIETVALLLDKNIEYPPRVKRYVVKYDQVNKMSKVSVTAGEEWDEYIMRYDQVKRPSTYNQCIFGNTNPHCVRHSTRTVLPSRAHAMFPPVVLTLPLLSPSLAPSLPRTWSTT